MLGLERRLVYFPDRTHLCTPASLGLAFEEVWIETGDGVRLNAWWIPGRGPSTVLLFHGNAGNISFRLGEVAVLNARLDVSVLLVDYRGFGLSEGRPTEQGTRLDAEAAASYLIDERGVDPRRLVYFGRSLGGAVATRLALTMPPAALILEAPLPSLRRMARASSMWLSLVSPLFITRYDTLGILPSVRVPVFFAHGDQDETIPFELGQEAFAAANDPKVWYPVHGAGHNDLTVVGGEPYFDALRAFVTQHAAG